MSQEISCGFEFITTPDLQGCLTEALQCNYSFIVSPLIHPRFTRQHSSSSNKVGGFTRSDMILSPQDWTTRIVGRLSQHWNADISSPLVRQRHEDCLTEELGYCKGLGLPAITLPLHGIESNNLARILLSYFESSHHPALIWTRVPMVCRRTLKTANLDESRSGESDDDPWNETWFWWSKFHERLEWDKRVGVVLELSADLPSQQVIDRWLGEPVKAIVIPTHLFHNNKKGFPVLSRVHQQLVVSMVEHEAQVIISGARRHDMKHYLQYMHRLWMRRPNMADDPMLQYARGWEDYLQTPLQPLADNLDTHTYNVFEKDPIKYDQYQKAIAKALTHFKNKAKKAENDKQIEVQDLISKLEIGQGDNKEKSKTSNKGQIKTSPPNEEQGEKGIEKQIVTPTSNDEKSKISTSNADKSITCSNEDQSKTTNEEPSKTPTSNEEQTKIPTSNEVQSKTPTINEENSETSTSNEVLNKKSPITVMVLGAGRGPLVRATFNASDITNTKVKVIAVEKNPCAVVVLAAQVREVWRGRDVTVVPGDMRRLNLSPKADIIVSELLEGLHSVYYLVDHAAGAVPRYSCLHDGLFQKPERYTVPMFGSICSDKDFLTQHSKSSWGDNELSPECLDGAAGLLKPGGISIPSQYTSYVAPISSARLWAAAKSGSNDTKKEKNLETLWVVYMQNKHSIAETKPVFTFDHPAKGILDYQGQEMTDWRGLPLTDNRRAATVTWEVKQDSVMHGFGGYFDCTLYGGEMLSIVPSTHSPGMISWFPVFIPITTPLRVRRGEKIKATFWRCVDSHKVWYEWLVQVGDRATSIHNTNGRSSEMLL